MSNNESNTTFAFFFMIFCLMVALFTPQLLGFTAWSFGVSLICCVWGIFVYYMDTMRLRRDNP